MARNRLLQLSVFVNGRRNLVAFCICSCCAEGPFRAVYLAKPITIGPSMIEYVRVWMYEYPSERSRQLFAGLLLRWLLPVSSWYRTSNVTVNVGRGPGHCRRSRRVLATSVIPEPEAHWIEPAFGNHSPGLKHIIEFRLIIIYLVSHHLDVLKTTFIIKT